MASSATTTTTTSRHTFSRLLGKCGPCAVHNNEMSRQQPSVPEMPWCHLQTITASECTCFACAVCHFDIDVLEMPEGVLIGGCSICNRICHTVCSVQRQYGRGVNLTDDTNESVSVCTACAKRIDRQNNPRYQMKPPKISTRTGHQHHRRRRGGMML